MSPQSLVNTKTGSFAIGSFDRSEVSTAFQQRNTVVRWTIDVRGRQHDSATWCGDSLPVISPLLPLRALAHCLQLGNSSMMDASMDPIRAAAAGRVLGKGTKARHGMATGLRVPMVPGVATLAGERGIPEFTAPNSRGELGVGESKEAGPENKGGQVVQSKSDSTEADDVRPPPPLSPVFSLRFPWPLSLSPFPRHASTPRASHRIQEEQRGKYRCGRCGKFKVNHVCTFVVDTACRNISIQVTRRDVCSTRRVSIAASTDALGQLLNPDLPADPSATCRPTPERRWWVLVSGPSQ